MDFIIDKKHNMSIYNQIVNQIVEAVDKGVLKPGERLPTQRELSTGLNISRGTIQKAYEELEKKGIVEILKGSGSFVSNAREAQYEDRKKAANNLINELLIKLEGLNFTSSEIRAFFDIGILERENKNICVRIAAIDCNPEALEIFKIQISSLKNVQFRIFILDDILKYSQPDKVFEDYDIIITTLNHYDELNAILYSIREKLFKVVVSPESETIIKIATIPKESRIGIITKSIKFRDIIFRNLESFNINKENVEWTFEDDVINIRRFLDEKDFLIIPQSYELHDSFYMDEYQTFLNKGSNIIEFKYQIERGSLIYIEEQIANIIHSR